MTVNSEFIILENKLNENYLKFEVNNIPVSVVNGIRRCILSFVECVSIDPKGINISKNTGLLHEQFLEDRLSFIPLNVDPNEYQNYEIKIHDSKNSDKPFMNENTYPIYIYTDDLKVYKNGKISNENIFVGNSKLLYLKPEQEIKLSMKLSFFLTKLTIL